MNHEQEQHRERPEAPSIAHHREAVEPGRSSRSAQLRGPERAVASGLVQRKARDANGVADGAEDAVAEASSSSGASLPAPLMRRFEGSLGADLSGVRIHTGDASARAADAVGAKAYTMGSDIHFGAGQYDPASSTGQHLLAHEVAHTVQQSGGARRMQRKLEISSPGDDLEQEADRAADSMISGEGASVSGASGLSRRATLYRYTSGEHAQLGETGGLIADKESLYTVQRGETPDRIAKKIGVPVGVIKDRNKDKLIGWVVEGRKIEGFEAGAKIRIPEEITYTVKKGGETLEQIARKHPGASVEALKERYKNKLRVRKDKGKQIEWFPANTKIQIPSGRKEVKAEAGPSAGGQQTIMIQGIPFSYGEVIALGDFYKSPTKILNAPKDELRRLQELIQRQAKRPGSVTEKEWNDATAKRPNKDEHYAQQAFNNAAHFAPSNPALAPASGGSAGENHKETWQRYHREALKLAQRRDLNQALLWNAYGDHFLTDAFAAGHLINKKDVMAKFRARITDPRKPKSKDWRDALCERVATKVFEHTKAVDYLKRFEGLMMIRLPTAVPTPVPTWWSINSASRFADVLKGIDDKKPEVIENAIALIVHDKLNHSPKIRVMNKNRIWHLSGDETLNKESKEEAQKAVAQSQVNVMNANGIAGPLDFPALFKKVWDFTPRLMVEGTVETQQEIDKGTDPDDAQTISEVAEQIRKNIELIMPEVVALAPEKVRGPKAKP